MHNIYRNIFQYNHTKSNPAIRVMLWISAFFMFSFGMFSPLYAIFVEKIGGDITTAANAWAIFSLTAGVLTFITGRMENKLKETELAIAWSQIVLGAAYFVYYLASDVTMLYLAQVFLGAGMALYWPAFHSVYGKHVERGKAVAQWGIYDGISYLVPAVAAVTGGWLVKVYGFEMIFIVMALMSFFCGFFILVLPRKIL